MKKEKLRLGFIGLGIMGGPMAMNCIRAGYSMTVYNRTREKAKPFKDAGANIAESPAELAEQSDIILSCVTAGQDVLAVILDEQTGVVAGVQQGATVIDHSTVGPEIALSCAEALAGKGAWFLDAPISGGDVGAQNGTLSIMVGGEEDHFQRALPVLNIMGKTVTRCGDAGAGYTVKLCNQICGALHLVAAAEALALADASGVDLQAMLQAVSGGAAGSWMLNNLAPKMAAGDYAPGFFVDYQLKDLRLASDAAHNLGLPLAGSALAEVLFRAASAQGHGRDGTQSIYEVVRKLGGK